MTFKDLRFTDEEISVLDEALAILKRRATAIGVIDARRLDGALEYLSLDYNIGEARSCHECASNCSFTCYSDCKDDCAKTCKGSCNDTCKNSCDGTCQGDCHGVYK